MIIVWYKNKQQFLRLFDVHDSILLRKYSENRITLRVRRRPNRCSSDRETLRLIIIIFTPI